MPYVAEFVDWTTLLDDPATIVEPDHISDGRAIETSLTAGDVYLAGDRLAATLLFRARSRPPERKPRASAAALWRISDRLSVTEDESALFRDKITDCQSTRHK